MNLSKVFLTFLLTLLRISGHNSYNYVEPSEPKPEPNLCNEKYRTNFEVKSIFNLKNNIYMQSRDQSGNYDMWKIPIIPYDPDEDVFFSQVNPHSINNDFTQTLKHMLFDLEQPVYGFVVEQDLWPDWFQKCIKDAFDGSLEHWCLLKSVRQGPYKWKEIPELVCLFGKDIEPPKENNRRLDVMFHDPITGRPFDIIKIDKKVLLHEQLCNPERNELDSSVDPKFTLISWARWQKDGFPIMEVFIREHIPSVQPNISQLIEEWLIHGKQLIPTKVSLFVNLFGKTFKFKSYFGKYNKSFVSMAFYYNDYIKFVFCGHPCTLDSTLQLASDFQTTSFGNKSETKPANKFDQFNKYSIKFESIHSKPSTLRTLFNCESLYFRYFEPNLFCTEQMKFLSIFNLGRDVYFQKSGRFWRYIDNGFRIYRKGSHVRYDSEFTNFLENEGFDTTSKIIGVHFKGVPQSMCSQKYSKQCQKNLFESDNYIKVCLFGVRGRIKYPDQKVGTVFFKSYQYTPTGLIRWTETFNNLESKTTEICKEIADSGHYPKWGSGSTDPFEEFSITNPVFLPEGWNQFLYINDYNVIFSLNNKDDRKGQNIPVQKWLKKTLPYGYNNVEQILLKKEGLQTTAQQLFSMRGQIWGYFYHDNGSLYKFNYVDNYLEENFSQNLTNLLNCPFIPSISVDASTFRRQQVCTKYDQKLPESVFYIGEYMYHQKGNHFYRYLQTRHYWFHYDSYVTNMLNDVFDTSKRVTGYSYHLYNLGDYPFGLYDVVIYGTSNSQYCGGSGRKVYALYRFRQNRDPVLTAVNELGNEPKLSPFYNYITFGSYEQKGDRSIHKIIAYYAFTAEDKELVKKDNTIFIYVQEFDEDMLVFHMTHKSVQLNYPFDPHCYNPEYWTSYYFRKDSLPFDEIVGFVKKNGLLLVTRSKDKPMDWQQFVFSTDFDENGINNAFNLLTSNRWDLKPFNKSYQNLFCPFVEQFSESLEAKGESSTSKILSYILCIIWLLLFIILIIFLITSFVLNDKNTKKQSEPNDINPNSMPKIVDSVPITSKSNDKPVDNSPVAKEDSVRSQ